jgi:ribonuclease Z
MKKAAIIITVAVLGLLAYSQRATILTRVMERGLETRMDANIVDTFEDGLHLALCGAGGPMPAPNASGPCVVVVAGKQVFVVDAGTDGLRNIARMGYQTANIEGVFLSHFHSDHIDGLGEMATIRWASGANTSPLPVYGPEGVQRIVDGFNTAYSLDAQYRHAHHGDTVAPLSGAGMIAETFSKPAPGELVTVYSNDDLKIEALSVDHSPVEPAVGYRFTYKDRSLLITGDTIKLADIEQFARGVDLLVHEALAPNLVGMMHDAAAKSGNQIMAKITEDILTYHATPVEAAETARDAGVGHLLYYHIVPPLVFPGQDILYLNGAQDIFPDYTIGQDGVSFSLPTGSKEIIVTSEGL